MPRSSRTGRRQPIDCNEAVAVEPKGSVFERHSRLFMLVMVVFALVLTRAFDFTLMPPEYRGICIARPFCNLHSPHEADRAWAGRSHVKYGLDYTKGSTTLVVGDPPPMLPLYCASHPTLESWLSASGVLLFGMQDWSVRVFDMVLSIACLVMILVLLRKLYGSECALLSGLLLVLLPLSGFSGLDMLTLLLGSWVLYRYLQLVGRVTADAGTRSRRLLELAVALFLIIQLNWVGIFYALAIGMHHTLSCMRRRQIPWRTTTVLAVSSLTSLSLSLYATIGGLHHNMVVEAPYESPGMSASNEIDSPWETMKSLYEWHASEGEQHSCSWFAWCGRNLEHAQANFTAPVLVFLAVYLLYLAIAHLRAFGRRVVSRPEELSKNGLTEVRRTFRHMWFLLLPGLAYLFVFNGPAWEHQYSQSSLALFVAVGTALGLLLAGDVFGRIHPWFGRSVVAALVLVLVVFCNQELAECRAVRRQSPRTLALFKKLNREIPPDKALLTFRDFTIQRYEGRIRTYQPEYAWYLDREMIPANVWRYEPYYWSWSIRIDDIAAETVKEVQAQAQTGLFWYYHIPAREEYRFDPLATELKGREMAQILPDNYTSRSAGRFSKDLPCEPWVRKPAGMTSLNEEELERRLNDDDPSDDKVLYWEKHRRYREAVIESLKSLYHYEHYDNRAMPGDEDFCYRGNTPCYLFDLLRPK